MKSESLAAPLIAYVHGVRYDSLPPAVTERAIDVIVDTVGCAIGGALTEPAIVAARVLRGLAGSGQCTALGIGSSLDAVSAAGLNAYLADILDYEDTIIGLGHPSAVIVPAALAVGEMVGAAGHEVVAAVVAGYEAGLRVGRAVLPSWERFRDVPVFQSWKAFGAVAAACKLLGLGTEATLDAFGYAGASSPVPLWYTRLGRPAHWLKGNYVGQVQAGVLGALMAREGFRGPRRILDSELGFWKMIGSDRFDAAQLTMELGTQYEILDTYFKPYPTCHWLHTTVEAVRALATHEHVQPADVEEIVVRSFHNITDWFTDAAPKTLVDAEFSIPYAVAVTLLGVPVGPSWYSAETLGNPLLAELARRVHVESSAAADAGFERGLYPVEVVVRTRSGRCFTAVEDVPRGGPSRPLTRAELDDKFIGMAEFVLGRSRAHEASRMGRDLASLKDVRAWTARLVPAAGR